MKRYTDIPFFFFNYSLSRNYICERCVKPAKIAHHNWKGGLMLMLTIEDLLAVLSFGLACFSVGFAIGRKDNNKTQK